ncbi:hypothetical protein SNE40_004032 [Patella caerulea]|uniref:CARD domain-containing protein n=1 Tax=Patella caerulea TaxID=87958 RepID=A0AAN8Q0X1_PATCE
MPDASYVKIQTNFMYLLENIDPECLCRRLFSESVLDSDDMERIYKMKDCRGRKYATDFLLVILQYRGDVYDIFIECLKECGYDSVVDRLEMGGGDSTGLLNEVNNARNTLDELQGNYGNTKKELAKLKEKTLSIKQKIQLLQESNIEIACKCEATNTDLAEEKTKHEVTCRELKNTKTDLAEEKAKHEVTRKELIGLKNTSRW